MTAVTGSLVPHAPILQQMEEIVGARATSNRAVLADHGRSEAYHPLLQPDVVVFPETTQEVSDIVRACARSDVPIVPFGAGTSLEGNAAAARGGVCVDLSRMNRLLDVHARDLDAVVQPGITRKMLNAQLRDTGLFFPIDPGADASIGGMASTRASGTMAVRYGTMRDNVLSLEVVMADGKVIRTASRARKSSAGYDLTRLFVGAEGTLGIITELTLRLYAQPEAIVSAVCSFPALANAVDAAIGLMQSAVPVARVELLDDMMMRGVNRYSGLSYRETPTLFLEFHGSETGVFEQSQIAETIAEENGGVQFQWARRPEERSRLWAAREQTLYAAKALRSGAEVLVTDVCVPLSRLTECVTETRTEADALGLLAPVVGHVGDGNFHMLVLIDPEDPGELAKAKSFHAQMIRRAIRMDGTCTGEHGVGIGKIDFLAHERGDAVDVMRAVKRSLDPEGLLNPGKIFGHERG
jgi:D-lactate dehydrogenase (cytochrome)